MDIIKICAATIVCVLVGILVGNLSRDLKTPILLLCATLLFGTLLSRMASFLTVRRLIESSGWGEYLPTLFKCFGICLVVDLSSSICLECGALTCAKVLTLIGKIEILILSLPLIERLLSLAKGVLV